MKNFSLLVIALFLYVAASAQITTHSDSTLCLSSPTGTDDNGWSIADYVIPTGYKIDSIYADFSRPSYPASEDDFIFEFSANTAVYNSQTTTFPFNYQNVNTSLYNTWINLDSFNYNGQGVARVRLPTNNGAVWNNFCIAISQIKDTTACISSPTGSDDNGWSIADYVVPAGYKLDSIFGDFTRTSYPADQQDFIFEFSANTAVYNSQTTTFPFNYQNVNTSLYNTWIDLTSFNYDGLGVARVRLPTNNGAVWNNFCLALSSTDVATSLPTVDYSKAISVYPNPAKDHLIIDCGMDYNTYAIKISNTIGQVVYYSLITQQKFNVDIHSIPAGVYILNMLDLKNNVANTKKLVIQ